MGTISAGSCVPLTHPPLFLGKHFLSFWHYKMLQDHLVQVLPQAQIVIYFFKKQMVPSIEELHQKPNLDSRCDHCYQAIMILSSLSFQTRKYVYVCTSQYIYRYTLIFLYVTTCVYIKLNMNSQRCLKLQLSGRYFQIPPLAYLLFPTPTMRNLALIICHSLIQSLNFSIHVKHYNNS